LIANCRERIALQGTEVGLGTCFLLTLKRWPPADQRLAVALDTPARAARIGHTRSLPIVWLSVALFFVYAGIEAAVGQWAFTLFTEGCFVAARTAGLWVSIYWGSLAVG